MIKKIVAVALGVLMLASVGMTAQGDLGATYKGKTAYCVYGGETEVWVIRQGKQKDWDHAQKMFNGGVFMVRLQKNHPEYGWMTRIILRFGFIYRDTGWRKGADVDLNEAKDINNIVEFAYYDINTNRFMLKDLIFTEYKDNSKEAMNSMIYDEAKADYVAGQDGI
jgi:hypothetical protein